jgi:hypothetical protein
VPTRIRWIAHPSVARSKLAQVDFLIDGTLRGVEHEPPYNYGSDDFHGHLGWLVTSWLKPGVHRFTARARLKDGRTASDTVIARTTAAPLPPRDIAGVRWTRTVTADEIAAHHADIPAGKWELIFDRVGVWELDPIGTGVADHVVFAGDRVNVDAALWMIPYVHGHGTGSRKLNRYGHKDIGAGFREDGPPASYRWSVKDGQLTLTAVDDPSGTRRALWEGIWAQAQ